MTTTHAPVHPLSFEITNGPSHDLVVDACRRDTPLNTMLSGIVHAADGTSQYMEYDVQIVDITPVDGKPDTFTIEVNFESFKTTKGFYSPKNHKNWLNLKHA